MSALIDTNVLLSAALGDKLPERVVLFVTGLDDFRWLVTPEIGKHPARLASLSRNQISHEGAAFLCYLCLLLFLNSFA